MSPCIRDNLCRPELAKKLGERHFKLLHFGARPLHSVSLHVVKSAANMLTCR